MTISIWVGVLLLFGGCLAYPQTSNVPTQSSPSPSNLLSLNVNTKKVANAVSDHFLSITIEPTMIFSAIQNNLGSMAINMAKALSPAYVRISGPECNSFIFQGLQDSSQSSPSIPIKRGKNITITGWHWSQVNDFIAQTDLDLVVALNVMNRQQGTWNLSNTLDLISYSDKHSYDMAFQLGHDLQSSDQQIDGLALGKDAMRLRKVLEAFPRYINTPIVGPDAKSCDTQDDAKYLKSFIGEAGQALTALTYQVPFASEKSIENPTEMLNYITNQMEAKVWQKDYSNKYLGKSIAKKPIWIVESGSKDRKGDFTDGLIWAQRLVAGAKVGINVMMRKPSLTSLQEPTPDYWVSILHKALIGIEVFDVKMQSINKTRLETVAHCTRESSFNPNEGILAPDFRYTRGALSVFGVNMGTENVKISLKTGNLQSVPVHQYLLTSNNRKNKDKRAVKLLTLLNGQKLSLSDDGDLPILSPKIRESNRIITIPSQSVFFFVLPESKTKACMAIQIEELKTGPKNSLSELEDFESVDDDTLLIDQDDESISNEKNNFVSFRTKHARSSGDYNNKMNEKQDNTKLYNNDMKDDEENYSEPIVKYVTFSNNNWLSKFPKSLKNPEYNREMPTTAEPDTITMEIPVEQSSVSVTPANTRREKYHILAQAVIGKRHPDKKNRLECLLNSETSTETLKSNQKLKIKKRSLEQDFNPKEVDDLIKAFTSIPDEPIKEQTKFDTISDDDVKIPDIPIDNLNDNSDRLKREKTNHPTIPESQSEKKSTEPQNPTEPTPTTITTEGKKNLKIESYIQKIKSRAEQALAKANERVSQRHLRKKQNEYPKDVIVSSSQTFVKNEEPLPKESFEGTTKSPELSVSSLEATKDKSVELSALSNSGEIEKKSEKTDENLTVNHDQSSTTTIESSTTKLSKLLPTIPKEIKLSAPKKIHNARDIEDIDNGKSKKRESRQTLKSKTTPLLKHVKTSKNVDRSQTETNKKVSEVIIDNIQEELKPKMQSDNIVSPIGKKGERTSKSEKRPESNQSNVVDKLKEIKDKHKMIKVEMEQKIRAARPKLYKRSLDNNIIEDDMMDINGILEKERFESNDLDVDIPSVLKREASRYPRSLADLTLKLNEVNTYVDKKKHNEDPKTNEILDDDFNPKDWKITNDIRHSYDGDLKIKDKFNTLKNKKIDLEDIILDEDKHTNNTLVTSFINHMHKVWKYILKTFHL
ncbi:uncharacterized protein LOC126900791 [Daktulosphaira vitifoliae]|uniref:uncharacterized protein LOC126900791 n=1 Tax=Daktulosphaira vitifoliae TaxID=58002 RepID=UPI0021AA9D0D|nr:uncharacterized protein LOC126900791 [Daktulosphaira vitifoliae]